MWSMRTRIRVLTGAVCAGVGVAAAAHASGTPANPVARAAALTRQQPGTQFRMTQTWNAPGVPQPMILTGSGFVNNRDGTGRLSLGVSSIPGLSALSQDQNTTILFRPDGVVYLNSPDLASSMPHGMHWVRLTDSQAAQTAGLDVPQVRKTVSLTTEYLSYLLLAGERVTKLGVATVDGARTTRYAVTIPISRLVEQLPGSDRGAAGTSLRRLTGGARSLSIQVWIDSHNLVRREQFGLDLQTSVAYPYHLSTLTVDFVRFGRMPTVDAPPRSQVCDPAKPIGAVSDA